MIRIQGATTQHAKSREMRRLASGRAGRGELPCWIRTGALGPHAFALAACIGLGLLAIQSSVAAPVFSIEGVSHVPYRVGDYPSIGLDPTGHPHIAYRRDNDLDCEFRHAWWDGSSWNKQTIEDHSEAYASLAFWNGQPHVAYQDPIAQTARFASYDGSTWTTQLVDNLYPQEGLYTSLAFTSTGCALIAYQEPSTSTALKWAWSCPGGGSGYSILDGFGFGMEEGRCASIAVSSEDSIAVSEFGNRYPSTAWGLRLEQVPPYYTGDVVDVDTTLGSSPNGYATSCAFSSEGVPCIAYGANSPGELFTLRFAQRLESGEWVITVVDTTGTMYNHPGARSIALRYAPDGTPHILYQRYQDQALWHAYRELGKWVKEIVDATTGAGTSLDLAVGSDYSLHAAYHVSESVVWEAGLRYARWSPAGWSISAIETNRDDEGLAVDIAFDENNLPSIVAYDATNGDLAVSQKYYSFPYYLWAGDAVAEQGDIGRFVTALTPTVPSYGASVVCFDVTAGRIVQTAGTFDAWTEGLAVSVGTAVASMSVADSAGWVRVAYYDSLGGDLHYARMGPGDPSTVLVDGVGDVGRSCSLGLTKAGTPHIAYYDATGAVLKHASGDGSGWASETIPTASGEDVGRWCALGLAERGTDLAVDVVYYDATNGDLERSVLSNGTWTNETLDSGGDVGRGCAVAMDCSGYPRISYYDATNGDLKYATHATGTWETCVVDTPGDLGRVSRIRLNPTTGAVAIVYYDATLKCVRWASEVSTPVDVGEQPRLACTGLSVGPNPARPGAALAVKLGVAGRTGADIQLYDIMGRAAGPIVHAVLGNDGGSARVSVPSAAGVYFVEARLANGTKLTKRVVVLK